MAITMALLRLHIGILEHHGCDIDPNELLAVDYLDRHKWTVDTEEIVASGSEKL
jgi:hypothetical protein